MKLKCVPCYLCLVAITEFGHIVSQRTDQNQHQATEIKIKDAVIETKELSSSCEVI